MTQRFLVNPPMPDIVAQWQHYFSLLDCRPGDRVLDVGCDTGDADHLLLELAPEVRLVVGLDKTDLFSPQDSAVASSATAQSDAADASSPRSVVARDLWRARGASAQLAFVAADGAALPFRNASFERVFTADTLEWIPSPVTALEEMRRVLAPDGLALLIHTDFEMQAFEGPDPQLTRTIVQRFADSGPDGRIGRRLGILARQAGFRSAETRVYTLVNERYEHGSYARQMTDLIVRWLTAKRLMSDGGLRAWQESLERAAADGRFWYSVNRDICVCRP
jgi:arsenite methyltransferase